jgi:hypothetical protein
MGGFAATDVLIHLFSTFKKGGAKNSNKKDVLNLPLRKVESK